MTEEVKTAARGILSIISIFISFHFPWQTEQDWKQFNKFHPEKWFLYNIKRAKLKNYYITSMKENQKEPEIIYQRINLDEYYPLHALEPHISQEIMDDHYNGNHKLYEKNLNLVLSQLEKREQENIKKNYPNLEKLLQDLEKLSFSPLVKAEIRFHGGGLVNHNLFFSHLASQIISIEEKGRQERVSEDFLKTLKNDGFDGLDDLKERLIKKSLNNFIGDIRCGSY